MDVGTTVYFLWYDFFLECERMMQGVVEDNSLWADHPRNSQLVNVRFHMPGVHGTVCHHFPASRLCTDSVRALQECPHDDCYLVCTNHKATVPDGSPSGITPSDAWQQVQQFKQDHWDEAHGHLATDALDEYYQMWRDAIAAKRGYVHIYEVALFPAVASSPNKPTPPTTPTPPKRKKKQQQTNVIQLSLFD